MKNTKIIAVLVVFLAAMLFIGAASADTRDVTTGGTAFVYETINVSISESDMASGTPAQVKF